MACFEADYQRNAWVATGFLFEACSAPGTRALFTFALVAALSMYGRRNGRLLRETYCALRVASGTLDGNSDLSCLVYSLSRIGFSAESKNIAGRFHLSIVSKA